MFKRKTGKILNCLQCNKEVYIPINRLNTFKYCSRSCSGKASTQEITAICLICNTQFKHISSRCNKAKYCSRKCFYKSLNTKGTVSLKCHHCDKVFLTSPSDAKNRKYCSRSCVNKENKKEFKAKFTTVRKIMLTRDMIKECNRCGFNSIPEILGVHHKDRDRNNNEISNLEVLCPNCHSIEHMKHIAH